MLKGESVSKWESVNSVTAGEPKERAACWLIHQLFETSGRACKAMALLTVLGHKI